MSGSVSMSGSVMSGSVGALVGDYVAMRRGLGYRSRGAGARAAGLRAAPGPGRASGTDPAGDESGLGERDRLARPVQPGSPPGDGARVSAAPVRDRRRDRGARARAARPSRAPHAAARVFRPGDRRAAAGGDRPGTGRRAAATLLRRSARADRVHGPADQRSAGPDLRATSTWPRVC